MDNYMKLCTEETTEDELWTIIQTVKLQEQGKVNWVSSLINNPTILNVDASRTPKSNRSTLEVDDIKQAQIEDSVIGKVYSWGPIVNQARDKGTSSWLNAFRFSGRDLHLIFTIMWNTLYCPARDGL